MKRSSWAIVGIICALAAALVYFHASGRPKPLGEEHIQMLLAKGQSAIERKDLKGVMSCISKDYSDSAGFTFDILRAQALEVIGTEGQYDVLLEHTSVEAHRNTAIANTQVTVYLVLDHHRMHQFFNGPITLHLRKEKSKRFLVIPTRIWKVARIDGLPYALSE